jgi:hypothetical protein
MASFVEEATLRIDDQSTKQINAVNKSLNQLFKNAKRFQKLELLNTKSFNSAKRQVDSLARSLKKLPRQRSVTVNVNQNGKVPRIPRNQRGGPGSPTHPVPVPVPRGRGGSHFTSNGALRIAQAIITSYGAIRVGSAALTAVNEAQSQDTRERSIFSNNPGLQKAIAEAAVAATLATPRIDQTRSRGIATDLALGGVTDKNLAGFTTLFANTESSVGALFPGLEKSVTAFNNKFINLANSTDDLARSQKLAQGAAQGIAAAGETFSAPNALTAIRFSGLAPTINDKGVFNLIQLVDAMGGSAGNAISRLRKELFIPANQAGAGSGIAKGAVANLEKRGLRGFSDSERRLFTQDPASFIEQVLAPRISKQGVDINNREQLDKFLSSAGFNNTTQRLITQVLTSLDERAQQYRVTSGINVNNPTQGTEGNLALATTDLIASFNTLSSQILVPLAEKVAPLVSGVASFVEKVALTGTTLDKLQLAASAAAGVFVAYKAGTSIISQIFNPLNVSATNLNGSAAALTNAARALGGSSVAGGGGVPGSSGSKARLSTQFGIAGVIGGIGLAIQEYERQQRYGAMAPGDRAQAAQNEFAANKASDAAASQSIKDLMYSIVGKAVTDAITKGPVQGPPAPMKDDREASLDAFLAGPLATAPTQFEQAFTDGGQIAKQNLQDGLTAGATGVAEALHQAIINAGQQAAAAMGSAINNAQVRMTAPTQGVDTGAVREGG